jgi:hypothetical protein
VRGLQKLYLARFKLGIKIAVVRQTRVAAATTLQRFARGWIVRRLVTLFLNPTLYNILIWEDEFNESATSVAVISS